MARYTTFGKSPAERRYAKKQEKSRKQGASFLFWLFTSLFALFGLGIRWIYLSIKKGMEKHRNKKYLKAYREKQNKLEQEKEAVKPILPSLPRKTDSLQ